MRAFPEPTGGRRIAPSAAARVGTRPLALTVWLGVALLSLGLLFSTAWKSWRSYNQAWEDAKGSVANIAFLLEQQMGSVLNAVRLVFSAIEVEAQQGAAGDITRLSDLVYRMASEATFLEGVRVRAADSGAVLLDIGRALPLRDGRAEAASPHVASSGLQVGEPLQRDTKDWMIEISNAFTHRGRTYVATGEVGLARVQQLFEAIDVGAFGSVLLFRDDATLIARSPLDDRIGRKLSDLALFREELPKRPAGVYDTVSRTDGVARIVAYARVPGSPLVVAAALSRDEVLHPWRAELAQDIASTLAAILALAGFGVLLTREARRRDRAEASSRQESTLLHATLDNMDQGLLMVAADGTVPICNRRAMELLDLPPKLIASQPAFRDVLQHQFDRSEFEKSDEAFRTWVAQSGVERTNHSYERERPNGTVIEVRTVPLADGGAVRTYTDVTERKKTEARISELARRDALTGLPNRRMFLEELESVLARARSTDPNCAILCLDLDRFKTVNDTLGHPTGDALLAALASRLQACLRPNDLLARLGGDEFAVIQFSAGRREDLSALALRLVDCVRKPFVIAGSLIEVGLTAGIALAPDDGRDAETLLRNADLALYAAKAEGRGRFRFFEPEIEAELRAKRKLEVELRAALRTEQLDLLFQPIVEASSRQVVALEALLRWRHPERGYLTPDVFLPLAEETGLILPIGDWGLDRALSEAAAWPERMRVAINISPLQFGARDLVDKVAAGLARHGVEGRRVDLEITEAALLRSDNVVRAVDGLRRLGVHVVLDNFGTGPSSLSTLRNFAFDKLKIDHSFIREFDTRPDCAAIVRAIAGLGAGLGIGIAAEGVESAEQFELARLVGCTEMQGFYLYPPLRAAELQALFADPAHGRAAERRSSA